MTTLIILLGFMAIGGAIATIVGMHLPHKKELAPPPSDLPALACDALVTRVFEDRLVTAGIMEVADMTVCDAPVGLCKDCAPTHKAIEQREWDKRVVEQKDQPIKSIPRKKSRKRLTVGTPGGITVETDWPRSVPEYAAAHYIGEASSHAIKVGFNWTGPDGKQIGQTMLVSTLEKVVPTTGRGIPDDGNIYS